MCICNLIDEVEFLNTVSNMDQPDKDFRDGPTPEGMAVLDAALKESINVAAGEVLEKFKARQWQPIENKPKNMPGELRSRDVLLCYTKERQKRLCVFGDSPLVIGHVSNGHWRPRGGNGNFDSHFCAWMELPDLPNE